MASCKFEFPFEPHDTIYYVPNDEEILRLYITQIQIIKDYATGITNAYICFSNFHYISFEKIGISLFTDLEKAKEKLKELREIAKTNKK